MMDGYRSEDTAAADVGDLAAVDDSAIHTTGEVAREGDVIRGLRSGLIFSLAIWAMLFTVGALVFV